MPEQQAVPEMCQESLEKADRVSRPAAGRWRVSRDVRGNGSRDTAASEDVRHVARGHTPFFHPAIHLAYVAKSLKEMWLRSFPSESGGCSAWRGPFGRRGLVQKALYQDLKATCDPWGCPHCGLVNEVSPDVCAAWPMSQGAVVLRYCATPRKPVTEPPWLGWPKVCGGASEAGRWLSKGFCAFQDLKSDVQHAQSQALRHFRGLCFTLWAVYVSLRPQACAGGVRVRRRDVHCHSWATEVMHLLPQSAQAQRDGVGSPFQSPLLAPLGSEAILLSELARDAGAREDVAQRGGILLAVSALRWLATTACLQKPLLPQRSPQCSEACSAACRLLAVLCRQEARQVRLLNSFLEVPARRMPRRWVVCKSACSVCGALSASRQQQVRSQPLLRSHDTAIHGCWLLMALCDLAF